MKTIALLAVLASLLVAFGAAVLPRAASTEPPRRATAERSSVVLAAANSDDYGCSWKRATASVRLSTDA